MAHDYGQYSPPTAQAGNGYSYGGQSAPDNGGAGMYPPAMPPMNGTGRRASGRRYPPVHRPPVESVPLLVRPFAGVGLPAQFDPATGALHAVSSALPESSGFYADLGDTVVVLYRDGDGLVLRAGGRAVDLDSSVEVRWERSAQRVTRFAVLVAGQVQCELIYRSLPPELDLGLLVRDVVADPSRRTALFQ